MDDELKISPTLIALLNYAKADVDDGDRFTLSVLRDNVLGARYSTYMSDVDVLNIVVRAYEEAYAEPRFEISKSDSAAWRLIKAPALAIQAALGLAAKCSLDTPVTLRQVYQRMVTAIMIDLWCARVDWCSELLVKQ